MEARVSMAPPRWTRRPDPPTALTCADARVPNPNGAAQEASGLTQVTGRDVGNVVVATEFLSGV